MDVKNLLGERIKTLRNAANLTQKQLGEAVDLSMQAINNIENGHRETKLSKVVAIAQLFDTTVEYLAGATDDPRGLAALDGRLPLDGSLSLDGTVNFVDCSEIPDNNLFADRLKALRQSCKPTQKAVGGIIGVKTQPVPTVTPSEFALIEKLRALPPEKRKAIETLLE